MSVASAAVAAARGAGRTIDRLLERPRAVLGTLIGAQIAATVVLALSVTHNGWVYFQGGDQIWLATQGWLLGQLELAPTELGYLGSYLLTPIMWVTGPTYVQALPPLVLLQVLVLGPIALLCVYGIATRVGGRLLGYWASFLWVAAPFASIPLFVDRYQERWAEHFLPQALGLTAMADFPSTVLVLAAVLYVVRSLSPGHMTDAVFAGVLLGAAGALKPPNLLVAVRRRARLRRRAQVARGTRVRRRDRARAPRPGRVEVPRTRRGPRLRAGASAAGHGLGPACARAEPRPLLRARLRPLASADGSIARVLLERASRAVGAGRRTHRGPPRTPRRDRSAARRLARCFPRRQGILAARRHPGEHVLAAADARLACISAPLCLDSPADPDVGASARQAAGARTELSDRPPLDRCRGDPDSRAPGGSARRFDADRAADTGRVPGRAGRARKRHPRARRRGNRTACRVRAARPRGSRGPTRRTGARMSSTASTATMGRSPTRPATSPETSPCTAT